MTDPTTFSYTFSANPAPKRPGPAPELFAVDKLSEFPLGIDQVLARNPRNGRELALPVDHVKTLVGFCSVFRMLDEHVAELMKGSDGSPQRAAAIRQVVQSFRDAGLTLSAQDICHELAPVPGASPITDKPVVVIITCDRPPALERLLGSIRENCDLEAVDRLWVVDDSRSAESGDRNRELTAAAGAQAPVDFHYFGATAARELLDALIQQLPQHEEAIRFLLDRERWIDHKSYGLARNISHLLSVGKPVVVFDDDALCEAYDTPFRTEGVAFNPGQQEAAFYTDHEEWKQGLSRAALDPVAAHLQCLGLAVPEALSVLGLQQLPQEALRPAPVGFARNLKRDSRVLITECGSLGDPGTGGNIWLANMPAASRERLARSEGLLQSALEKRCCWLGRELPTFRPFASISQVTGFDNRGYLPPYFPITRGEDRLFGEMTRYIYPDSVALEYPWAAPHLPLEERGWSEAENNYAIGTRFPGTLLKSLLGSGDDCLAADPLARLAFLASRFADLAGASDATLLNLLAEDRLGYKAGQIRKLQSKIQESADLPGDWRAYLEKALQQIQSSKLGDFRLESLKGVETDLEGAELLRFWRDMWRGFGQSMSAWSDIREAARDIVAKTFP